MWTRESLINKLGYDKRLIFLDNLVDIWNIIGDTASTNSNYLLIADDKLLQIDKYIRENNLDSKFTRKWYEFDNNLPYKTIMSLSVFWEKQHVSKLDQMDYAADLQKLANLREKYGHTWKDLNQIEKDIGKYDVPFVEYYWTIIGDAYKKKDWKENILLRQDIYDKISIDKTFKTFPGYKFLNTAFKNSKGYNARIADTYVNVTANESGAGIYGIYYQENEDVTPELIYIGLTEKGFESRWQEHKDNFANPSIKTEHMFLYKHNLDPDKISYKPIIDIRKLLIKGELTTHDLQIMKLTCIDLYKPKYNIQGILQPMEV